VAAGITGIDVTPQPRGSAGQDPVDDRTLLPAPSWTRTLGLGSQVPPKDLRDLVLRSLGHLPGGDELRS